MRNSKHIVSALRAVLSLLLIAVLMGPAMHHWSESIAHGTHEHGHSHEQKCSELAEQNPCHRKLVHNDESRECGHDAHITTYVAPCELCTMVPVRQDVIVLAQEYGYVFHSGFIITLLDYQEKAIASHQEANESRGPPCLSSYL